MRPKQGCLASTYWEKESSKGKSVEIKSALESSEIVVKEPPQAVEANTTSDITKGPKVNMEPPQADFSSA